MKTALLSVSDKTGIVEFAQFLQKKNLRIISTGGTAKLLQENGINVKKVSDVTGFPEILDGRVKTLHPNIHGGILADFQNPQHQQTLKEHHITKIDLVVINLYPFAQTIKKTDDFQTCIENIDIGGPAMIRASAKNHKNVVILTSAKQYKDFENSFDDINYNFRKNLAKQAFAHTASYDSMIHNWLEGEENHLTISAKKLNNLRYGENPHQNSAVYVFDKETTAIINAEQIQGKELSYNNIADSDSAFELISEFDNKNIPATAIIKHANPCGVAVSKTQKQSLEKALECDPVSAFGGIFAFNTDLEKETAEILSKMFLEVIITPNISEEAKNILAKKKNLRILLTGKLADKNRDDKIIKSVAGGFLLQTRDNKYLKKDEINFATNKKPDDTEMNDLNFANIVCKYVHSNAITIAKDGQSLGLGAGQMSRVDSVKIAINKAKEVMQKKGGSLDGAVLASDAFFPFADSIEHIASQGIKTIIQPGGSIRDEEVIEACNKYDIAMVLTKTRHFRH